MVQAHKHPWYPKFSKHTCCSLPSATIHNPAQICNSTYPDSSPAIGAPPAAGRSKQSSVSWLRRASPILLWPSPAGPSPPDWANEKRTRRCHQPTHVPLRLSLHVKDRLCKRTNRIPHTTEYLPDCRSLNAEHYL